MSVRGAAMFDTVLKDMKKERNKMCKRHVVTSHSVVTLSAHTVIKMCLSKEQVPVPVPVPAKRVSTNMSISILNTS